MASSPSEFRSLLEQAARSSSPDGARLIGRLLTASPKLDLSPAAVARRFKALLEEGPVMTLLVGLGEEASDVYLSPNLATLLGYTDEEPLTDLYQVYSRLHPEDRARWTAALALGVQTTGPFVADWRFVGADGRTIWVHGEGRVVTDGLGRAKFFQGVAYDITTDKAARRRLLERHELDIARRVQASVLPRAPAAPGLQIAARMVPTDGVGGDYYDVFPAPDGAWLAIGDVSGHGLDAGLFMLMVQSALSGVVRTASSDSPAELLVHVNRVMYENIVHRVGTDDYVTFCLFRYYTGGRLVFAGAHPPFLVVRADGSLEEHEPVGAWLGAVPDIGPLVTDNEVHLSPGDLFLFYTDGITEAMDEQRRLYGPARVLRLAAEQCEASVDEVADAILADVSSWQVEQTDDIALVVCRYHGR